MKEFLEGWMDGKIKSLRMKKISNKEPKSL